MSRSFALAALLVAGCSAPQQTYSREPYGWHTDHGWDEWGMIHLVQREFQDGSLAEGDRHFGLGLELAGQPRGAWLGLEFGLWSSSSEADWTRWSPVFRDIGVADLDFGEAGSRSFEISLGARKEVRPFGGPVAVVGGLGVAMVQLEEAEQGTTFDEDSDADLGIYGHWGAYLEFDAPGRIGFDVRVVEGTEHDLRGRTTSGDYTQWSFVVSFFF